MTHTVQIGNKMFYQGEMSLFLALRNDYLIESYSIISYEAF